MPRQSGAIALALLLAVDSGAADRRRGKLRYRPGALAAVDSRCGTRFSRRSAVTFTKSSGKVTLDRAAKTGSIDVTIDTTSIRSHDAAARQHPEGRGLFQRRQISDDDVQVGPACDFDGDQGLTGVEGELTMLGVTRPVTLKVTNFAVRRESVQQDGRCAARKRRP